MRPRQEQLNHSNSIFLSIVTNGSQIRAKVLLMQSKKLPTALQPAALDLVLAS